MGQQDVLYPEQASFEFGSTDEGFTHFDERFHYENAHLNGFRAVKNVGSHDSAMLGKCIGQFSPPTMAGIVRQLRPDIRELEVAICDFKFAASCFVS